MKRLVLKGFILSTLLSAYPESNAHESDSAWDDGVSKYQRFLLEPHLDAGFRYLNQKKYDDAIREFTRAREIADRNPMIAIYLAQTYRASGQLDMALKILREQIKATPNQDQLLATYHEYEQHDFDRLISQAKAFKSSQSALRTFLKQNKSIPYNAYTETVWMNLLAEASTPSDNLIAQYVLRYAENQRLKSTLILEVFIREDDAFEAKEFIDRLSQSFLADIPLIDSMSYQLLSKSHPDTALKLLLRAYPFQTATKVQRKALLNRIALAQATAKDKLTLRNFLESHNENFASAKEEKVWLRTVLTALPDSLDLVLNQKIEYSKNEKLRKKVIVREIASGASIPPDVDPLQLLDEVAELDPELVDVLSYRELELGYTNHAWKILISRYPFPLNNEAVRLRLMDRMALIMQTHPDLANASELKRLSVPLASSELRSLQAQILAGLKDCTGVIRVLGDFSKAYSASDWTNLGDCYNKSYSGLAQHAYAKAFALDPSVQSARALAFSAYRDMDYDSAMQSWTYVIEHNNTSTEDLRAAVVTALAAQQLSKAREWLNQYESLGGVQSAQYWELRARILASTDSSQAIESMQNAMKLNPTGEGYLLLAKWQREAGDFTSSKTSLQLGVALDPKNAPLQADLGIAYYREGDYHDAKEHMESALAMRPNDFRLIEQLAYTDQRLGENQSALSYIERAIDHQERLPAEDATASVTDRMYALRRMHEDLERRWTFSFDAMMGSGPSASVNSPQPGQDYRSYAQTEIDYRLGNPSIDNGKTFSVYARVFGSSQAQGTIWPINSPMLGTGLRLKPFSEQIVYLAVEKQVPLDQGSSTPANTMLRLSGSFLNNGKKTDDWHPLGTGWLSQNLYLDSAYYLSNQAYSLTADYRLGYHNKLTEGQTLQPYVRGLANKVSTETTPDLRVGIGLQWNLWNHQSEYNAYASKTYLALELQYAVKTYRSDKVTALLNMGFRW